MEGWGKTGVQSASTTLLHPNSCYKELCYIEVQVYFNRKGMMANKGID